MEEKEESTVASLSHARAAVRQDCRMVGVATAVTVTVTVTVIVTVADTAATTTITVAVTSQ